MPPLVKLRSERDQMSAIERRIADFILDNAQLLRDYSSQQLASALGVSQSSVVKFSQKFGFKGYPDLKYSIGQALARNGGNDAAPGVAADGDDDYLRLEAGLRQSKAGAEEETRLLNPRAQVEAIVGLVDGAGKVFVCGLGDDGLFAREFAMRLSLLGMLVVDHADPILMMANLSATRPGDVLLVFSEQGMQPALYQLCRYAREQHARVVTVTRHSSNPLRAHADVPLLVSAHDERPHIAPLLYHSALQHLLDRVFAVLCESDPKRRARLQANLERIREKGSE